jgi:hypothetical protein
MTSAKGSSVSDQKKSDPSRVENTTRSACNAGRGILRRA